MARGGMVPVWSIIALCAAVEVTLSLADLGVLEPARLRRLAYEYGGFWPGLLGGWQPNYPLQPAVMFASYGFLHGGPGHLAVNMVTLWSLGHDVARRVGPWRFTGLYGVSLLGGAAGYALLARAPQPMVGASGALFGLAGVLLAWAWRTGSAGRLQLAVMALLLLAMNLAMYWALDGQLAWQTHLGGFLAGAAAGRATDPGPRRGPR